METAVSNPIEVTCVKDKYYGTLYGLLGYYEWDIISLILFLNSIF